MTKSPEAPLDHDTNMRQAIEVGSTNRAAPFGTVLVHRQSQEVVAKGVNASSANPTWHGEIVAINNYAATGKTNWKELTLYTTAEPCCMCQGAIIWAGIQEVVYGISIEELMELSWRQILIPSEEVAAKSWQREMRITGGVLADECKQLFLEAERARS